eukprot:3677305-Amphidinium_carterae.1
MQCVISDEEVLAVAAQQALAEVRSRLRSGSWLSSLEDDRRRIFTQWINLILPGIERTGLGSSSSSSSSSSSKLPSVLASLVLKAPMRAKDQEELSLQKLCAW